jgi:FkbM family methyltransferase
MNTAPCIAALGRFPVVSNILRWCAGQYPENSVVQIQHGHAAGLWWRRHHRHVNGYWVGHYELPAQEALCRELRTGGTFFDIGANAGFFTLVAARRVGPRGRCIAFEPSPDNGAGIAEQIEVNSLAHCSLALEAIADYDGTADFSFPTPGSTVGHLGKTKKGEQNIQVKVTTIDSACARFGRPNFIKMDIEGAEASALRGAANTLRDVRPGWLIELHGPRCEQQVKALLQEAHYDFFDLDGVRLNSSRVLPGQFIARPLPGGEP